MKVLFTVCGRAGSKGIKNKNIRNFFGKPLPCYAVSVIDLFLKRTSLDIDYDIVANSDSLELLEIVKTNSKNDVDTIVRDAALGNDIVGKVDVISDCLTKMEERKNCKYDMVIDLDLTCPLRTVEDLEKTLAVHMDKQPDVTITVAPARRNPYFNQVERAEKGFKRVVESNFTARQQAPDIFDINAAIYVYSPAFLKSGKGVLDGYFECVEMIDTGVLDLDHENDFELMEVIAKYFFENKKEYAEVYENI